MARKKLQLNPVSCALLLLLIFVLGYQAFANRPMERSTSRIATVDLAEVLDGLEQRAEAAAHIERMQAELSDEEQQRVGRLEGLGQQLEQLDQQLRDNNDELLEQAQKLEEEFVLGQLNYRAWLRFSTDKMDVETSLQLQELYRAIRKAVADMAGEEGYTLVLVNDSKGELMVNPESQRSREEQVLQQMRNRSMLYADDSIDITDELIERMNNQYRAGQARR